MATNPGRREAARQAERERLQQQLARRERSAETRRRIVLVSSVLGTLAVIAAVVALVLIFGDSGSGKTTNDAASGRGSSSGSTTSSPSTSTSSSPAVPSAACAKSTGAATRSFEGVTVAKATDLSVEPQITSHGTGSPGTLQCADLVTGTGAAATPTSSVEVQYAGVLYDNGKAFDSSWQSGGKPVSFPLTQVVAGFTQGIGGSGAVAPMRVGGRRVMILPGALAYGASPPAGSGIPANAALVFVVDLKKVS